MGVNMRMDLVGRNSSEQEILDRSGVSQNGGNVLNNIFKHVRVNSGGQIGGRHKQKWTQRRHMLGSVLESASVKINEELMVPHWRAQTEPRVSAYVSELK